MLTSSSVGDMRVGSPSLKGNATFVNIVSLQTMHVDTKVIKIS